MSDITQYEEIVRNFVLKGGGVFFVVSTDHVFLKNLRFTLAKHLGLPQTCTVFFTERDKVQRSVAEILSRGFKVILLIERELAGSSSIEFVKYLIADIPDISVVVLTGEIERERLILLHELGVKNIITKPISANVLVEKIASTIRPPSKLGELIDQGKLKIFKREFEVAIELAKEVLALKPLSPAGLMLLGDALKGLGRTKEAQAAYLEASRQSNLYLEPLKKLAEFYREAGDQDRELSYLMKLDRLSPLNIERKLSIGGLNVQMGEVEAAKVFFDDAVKLTTRQAMGMVSDTLRSIAEMCLDTAPEMAESYLRGSLEARKSVLDKTDVETYNRLGIALRKQGKWEEAVKEYQMAQKVAPDDENVGYNLAMAHSEGRDFERASKELARALKLNPQLGADNPAVLYNIGYVFYTAGKLHDAKEALKRCLEIEPVHSRALELMSKLVK